MIHIQIGDIVSIQGHNDPFPSVGRVVEVTNSEDLALYECKLLINSGTDYLPYWVHIDEQTSICTLIIGEMFQLRAGIHEGELVRFSQFFQKAPTVLVTLEDGSDYYCPASMLGPLPGRMERN